jgi:RNA polymerase sigma factor (sigma-70 family)
MDPLETHASLLIRIRDPANADAWCQFLDLYMPLLHAWGMRQGLQDSDAADVSQETMRQVIRSIGQFDYDRERGSFRGWLLTIARNELRRLVRKSSGAAQGTGDSSVHRQLDQQPAPDDQAEFEREYQLRVFHWAADRVRQAFRESTWSAFWRSVVEKQEPAAVAFDLGISVGAVYIARTRVLAAIRREVALVEAE